MKTQKALRLSKSVTPICYTLHIHTDFNTHVFTGEESVELDIFKDQKNITLHSVDLGITSVTLRQGTRKELGKIKYDAKNEMAVFTFGAPISKGKAYLDIDFNGKLSDSLAGFYKSTYQENGKEKLIATTQFEATDARRAFPCFDEPEMKAVFDISLSVPKGKTAISNTLVIKSAEHSKTHETFHFSPTPKMSTYLLAFIIGDFEYLEKKTKRGIKVRVYTTKGKKSQGKFALECATRAIDFYEEYFQVEYPLPVLDMIAVPDFAAGAMENWGAVTYRETAILFDEKNSALANKQWVALVVAHELAHQWFGNLVTMRWWTDLWLNEGFASYIEYLCVDTLFPKWDMWEQFVSADLGNALALDALKNTHPVEVEVHHPDQISEIFDAISYEKGASLIRMLADHLGADVFRDSLRYYLSHHAYGNTVTTDLWKAFEKVSKKPVSKMMKAWTAQSGHPSLLISKSKEGVRVEQKRFYSSPIEKNKNNKDKTLWPIPFTYLDERGRHETILKEQTTNLKSAFFMKSNIGETGVYRSIYSSEFMSEIQGHIEAGLFSAEDRLGIIRDVHASVRNCDMSVSAAIKLLSSFRNEKHYSVWTEVISLTNHIRFIYSDKTWIKKYEKWMKSFLVPVKKYVGTNKSAGESHTHTMLRSLILGTLVSLADKDTVILTKKLYTKKEIDPDLRNVVYGGIVKSGDTKLFENLKAKYGKVTLHEEKNRIARAMLGTSSKKEFKKLLHFIIGKDVRNQDTPMYLAASLYNRHNRETALEFILDNWQEIVSRLSGDKYTFKRIIDAMDGFSKVSEYKRIEKFFNKNSHKGAERTLAQTLESIEAHIFFKKHHARELGRIFK